MVVCGVRLYRCGLVVVWSWLRRCEVECGWLMFGDCCMVQLLYVQPYTHEVVDWTLWRGGFGVVYGVFDTPMNASNCNGFSGGLQY